MAVVKDIGEIGGLIQEAFQTDGGLRRLLEAVLNSGMLAEASAHVGADVHERTDARRGYRNGSNRMAQRLAVYASQQRVAPLPRKTRFRLSAKLCRAGFVPAGFHKEVSATFSASHRFLLSRACLAQSPFHSPIDLPKVGLYGVAIWWGSHSAIFRENNESVFNLAT